MLHFDTFIRIKQFSFPSLQNDWNQNFEYSEEIHWNNWSKSGKSSCFYTTSDLKIGRKYIRRPYELLFIEMRLSSKDRDSEGSDISGNGVSSGIRNKQAVANVYTDHNGSGPMLVMSTNDILAYTNEHWRGESLWGKRKRMHFRRGFARYSTF